MRFLWVKVLERCVHECMPGVLCDMYKSCSPIWNKNQTTKNTPRQQP